MLDVAIFGNFAKMVKLIGNMANIKHVTSLIVQTFFDSFRQFFSGIKFYSHRKRVAAAASSIVIPELSGKTDHHNLIEIYFSKLSFLCACLQWKFSPPQILLSVIFLA